MKAIGQLFLFAILTASLFGCGGGNGSSQNTPTPSRDNTPPIITLTGDNPQVIEVGQAYVELGATATDNHDGDLTASIMIDASLVDSSIPGTYQVTYDVSDSSGNAAVTVIRSVIYEDRTPPQIFLSWDNPQTITQGSPYVELGATATDNVDGDLTNAVVIDDSAVDTSTVGSYEVSYDVEDSSGNAAVTVVRTVNVVAPPPNNAPTADISAPSDLSVYVVGDSIQFTGSGFDMEDGALSDGSLVWESDLDGQIGTGIDFNSMTLSAGTHQIGVTVTDSSGATDTATTLIRISDTYAEVYPSADFSRASELYRVEIEIDGVWTDAHAYQYARRSILWDWHQNAYPWVHWTTIGVAPNTPVNVRVTRLNRPSGSDAFTSVELQPSRYGIASGWNGDTITFTIEQSQKVYVRTNDQDFDTLFVFANPLKPPVPEGAKYFGPGVHDIGYDYHLLPNEQDVYLDGGAWVIGSIHTADITGDLRILGPGILSGEFEVWENLEILPFDQTEHYMLIHANPVGTLPFSVFIEGPTLLASPWFNVVLDFEYAKTIRNLHIISPWTYNTDGLVLGSNLTVTNTFVFNADDTVHAEYLADGDILVSDCVFGGRNSFLIGYGYFPTAGTNLANASRIDLVLQRGAEAFHGQVDGRDPTIVVDNQVYDDIVVDGDVGRLVYMTIEDTPWGNPEPAEGNIRNITFNNVTVKGVQESKSVIQGKDLNNRIDNVTFNNLIINGTAVTEANRDQFFDVDDTTVEVSFNP